ncbi:hypothetical protein ABTY20_06515 [Streptomyces sp. NPDC126497]|uniref:hypothetical protein n=1 Tax=Streptomyces sp. NPDC126497 TaxID=3155313 RepID=UPI0033311727
MVGVGKASRLAGRRLVVIDASVRTARIAHSLGCHTVFVQSPGAPVQDLVDDYSGYYTVDFAGRPDDGPEGAVGDEFAGFVEAVLRPLAPTAVVSLTARGLLPAAVANALLGTPGTPVEVLKRMAAGVTTAGNGGREFTAYTFTRDGAHRWPALLDSQSPPVRAEGVVPEQCLSPQEYGAAQTALNRFLDATGLEHGPARIRLWTGGGEVRVTAADHFPGDDEEAALLLRLTGLDLTRWALGGPLGLQEADCDDRRESVEGNAR